MSTLRIYNEDCLTLLKRLEDKARIVPRRDLLRMVPNSLLIEPED